MPVGLKTDFVIYDEQFWSGMIEVLQQNTDAFNTASNGALQLVVRAMKGDFEKNSYLKHTASLIARRDVTSAASVAATKLQQGENVGVKINRRIGPADMARDAFRKSGLSPEEFSFELGAQVAPQIAADYINVIISAVRTCIKSVTALNYNATTDTTSTVTGQLTHTALVRGMAKFGDKASRLTTFVSHSKNYFDLMQAQIADKLFEVAGATVYAGTLATFGKPFIVIDSPSLSSVISSVTNYDVLALVEGAGEVAESEERDIEYQPQLGGENIADRIQGEYAFNIKVKGFAYNTGAGANPADSTIATAASWTKTAFDNKLTAGVAVQVL